jgi:hypothetical protein
MAFPATRLRRFRKTPIFHRIVRETRFTADNLALPLFACPGQQGGRTIPDPKDTKDTRASEGSGEPVRPCLSVLVREPFGPRRWRWLISEHRRGLKSLLQNNLL